jgi:hypothetical protein
MTRVLFLSLSLSFFLLLSQFLYLCCLYFTFLKYCTSLYFSVHISTSRPPTFSSCHTHLSLFHFFNCLSLYISMFFSNLILYFSCHYLFHSHLHHTCTLLTVFLTFYSVFFYLSFLLPLLLLSCIFLSLSFNSKSKV